MEGYSLIGNNMISASSREELDTRVSELKRNIQSNNKGKSVIVELTPDVGEVNFIKGSNTVFYAKIYLKE
ncbi:MAG: hypothetical protein ACM3KR_02640 [Deltaproteobacteria bacterium]